MSAEHQKSSVIVKLDGLPEWERNHDGKGNPSGATMLNGDYLAKVTSTLEEAIEQARAQQGEASRLAASLNT